MIRLLKILTLFFAFGTNAQVKEVFLESRMDGSMLLSGTFDQVTFWGYGYEGDAANPTKITLPGPTLRFDLGDSVKIRLINTSVEAHTIHWHGLDVDQENDGVGHTSQDVEPGDTFDYQFVCTHAGTYMYHCHVQTPLHLAMGMYGLFIVNGETENHLYEVDTKFTKEFSFLFSEMNTSWNMDVLSPGPFALYEADYLMVNGFSGNQMNNSANKVIAKLSDTLAFRMANIGYGSNHVAFPIELNVTAVASDGRRINSFGTNEIDIHPGERFDFIVESLSAFEGEIQVVYKDLRNNNVLGQNTIFVEIEDDLSTAEITSETASFVLYPNPASNTVSFSINANEEWVILDQNGKQLLVDFSHNNGEVSIDISSLSAGIYHIKSRLRAGKLVKY
jgi:FtsP/CotA-like multicopper oxidase with cupredoxin domain